MTNCPICNAKVDEKNRFIFTGIEHYTSDGIQGHDPVKSANLWHKQLPFPLPWPYLKHSIKMKIFQQEKPSRLIGDNQFGAGDEAVGVGKNFTVGGEDFTPLTRGAIIFGGDRRKSIALLDNVNSWGLFGVRISYFVFRISYFVVCIWYFGIRRYG